MPPSRFNRTAWPEAGPHRELLDHLDAVHRRFGCRSLRQVGRTMHLSYSRVHDIVRGTSLPVSEEQVRSLVSALVGDDGGETEVLAREASELFVKARRSRDEGEVSPDPPVTPPEGPGDDDPQSSAASGDEAPEAASAGDEVPEPAAAGDEPTRGGPGANAATGPDARPADDGGGSGWRRHRRVFVAALALAVVAAAAATVTYVVAGPSEVGARTGGVLLQDSFGSSSLDPGKWRPATRADLIYPADGRLNFVIGPTDSAQGAEARLEPVSLDGYRSLSFVAGNPRVTKQGPGGVYLTLRESDGRNHRLFFGPGSEGPEIAALMCSRPECHTYDDYDPPGIYVRFRPGDQVPVRIVQREDGTVQVYARDQLIGQGPAGDAPLQTFTWDLYGAKSEAWQITAGSLIVSD